MRNGWQLIGALIRGAILLLIFIALAGSIGFAFGWCFVQILRWIFAV